MFRPLSGAPTPARSPARGTPAAMPHPALDPVPVACQWVQAGLKTEV
ncbi:hypothetical protein [Rhodoferax sp.]